VTTSDARQRAQIAAYSMHARHDTRMTTAAGRAAFLDRFEPDDPAGLLTEGERARRAAAARSAYFRTLALRSSRARRARAIQ
jgi:hypothetical protein